MNTSNSEPVNAYTDPDYNPFAVHVLASLIVRGIHHTVPAATEVPHSNIDMRTVDAVVRELTQTSPYIVPVPALNNGIMVCANCGSLTHTEPVTFELFIPICPSCYTGYNYYVHSDSNRMYWPSALEYLPPTLQSAIHKRCIELLSCDHVNQSMIKS